MRKLLVDITLSFLDKGGYRGREAEQVAAIVEKAEKKEYGGMFEAVIESFREEREEARAEGMAEGMEKGRTEGRAEYQLEVARNALAEGLPIDFVQKITGLSNEEIKKLQRE